MKSDKRPRHPKEKLATTAAKLAQKVGVVHEFDSEKVPLEVRINDYIAIGQKYGLKLPKNN